MVFFNVFFKTLGFFSALLIFIVLISLLVHFSNDSENNKFVMVGGNDDSNNILASINLNGPIFNNNSTILGNNFYEYINPEKVKSYLEDIEKLKVKILIIKINSPGGTVSASAELERILIDFKKKTNVKIYFYTKEILASGGYWVATSADKIFASYGSIIGSIGVSGPSWFYYNTPISTSSGFFGQSIETKNGIEVFNQNAGKGKDAFNPYRRPSNEEIDHLQDIVNEIYEDFITKVSKSRSIDLLYVKNNIGALIYSSNQAKNNFLIDGILDYDRLIKYIIEENKFENYKIYENKSNKNIIGNLLINYNSYVDNIHSYNIICKQLDTSVSVVIPIFLKNC